MTHAEQVALEAAVARDLDIGNHDAAATAIVRGYGPQVLGYLITMLRDHDVAADVFGQASEAVWRSLPAFRRDCSARTWFYMIAYRAARQYARAPAQRRGERLDSDREVAIADVVRTTTAAFQRTSVKDRLATLRAALSRQEQTLLILRLDRDLDWEDIARVLSRKGEKLTAASARKRFERVKNKLRELAERDGLLGSRVE